MSKNRRQYSRLATDPEPCRILLRGQEHDGFLIEESIGGVKICGLKLLNLVLGEPVVVNFREEEFLCWCRNVSRDHQGELIVGLERAQPKTNLKTNRMLVNTYVGNEGFHFICFATSKINSEPMTVCLWNRDELTLKREMLVSLTEPERKQQLSDPKYLAFVLAVYGRDAKSTTMEDVLNFEF